MNLRPYQAEAIEALNDYLRTSDGNPAIVLPTGAGKSVVMAALIQQYLSSWPDTRICIVAHVRELVAQNSDKLVQAWPGAPISVYSAGLGQRDADGSAVFASIQSVYNKGPRLGRWDLLFIDEAHRIPVKGEGMYRRFISDARAVNPYLRVIGFTATPHRLGHGMVVGGDCILSDVAYEASVRALIEQGYLCRLVSRGGRSRADISGVHVRGGEYVASELESALSNYSVVRGAVSEMIAHCSTRKSWIVFCAGVKHASLVSSELASFGIEAPVVSADTPLAKRDDLVRRFTAGSLRALCNVNVLSEGFDAPRVDAIIMLRPTKSAGLYCQQVGRGLRIHSDKEDCLVLDFAGNILAHGPVDAVRVEASKPGNGRHEASCAPAKECPSCNSIVGASARTCPECGHEFPCEPKHDVVACSAPILSDDVAPRTIPVDDVAYSVHYKRGEPEAVPSMRVDYLCDTEQISEWICVEHQGFAKRKAAQWWLESVPGVPMPATAEEADLLASQYARRPTEIAVRREGKYQRVVKKIY